VYFLKNKTILLHNYSTVNNFIKINIDTKLWSNLTSILQFCQWPRVSHNTRTSLGPGIAISCHISLVSFSLNIYTVCLLWHWDFWRIQSPLPFALLKHVPHVLIHIMHSWLDSPITDAVSFLQQNIGAYIVFSWSLTKSISNGAKMMISSSYYFLVFETAAYYVAQSGLILLPLPPECCDYRLPFIFSNIFTGWSSLGGNAIWYIRVAISLLISVRTNSGPW
jgi:hypothetical protein